MGLLDTKAMKFLFGDSAYMKNQRKVERAGDFSSLLGQPAGSQGQGPRIAQGLLGGQTTPEQFALQAATIPGYESFGGTMYNNIQDNDAAYNRQALSGFDAMNRQQQGQDFSMNNMTAAQRQTAGQQQYNSDQSSLFREMGYARQNEELYRNTTEMAGNILGSLADEDGFIDYDNSTGVQQNQLVVTLAKSILGNEAVNVDDRGAITLASGAPGWLGAVVAKMNGGNLGESDFYNVVDQLQNNIQTGMTRNAAMRDKSLGRMQQYGGNASNLPVPVTPVQRYRLKSKGNNMATSLGEKLFGGNDAIGNKTKLPVVTDDAGITWSE